MARVFSNNGHTYYELLLPRFDDAVLEKGMSQLSSYRVVFDKGTEWPTSLRKINSCVICKHAVLAESDAFWVLNEEMASAGVMRLTCSEECANMFILQNMDNEGEWPAPRGIWLKPAVMNIDGTPI